MLNFFSNISSSFLNFVFNLQTLKYGFLAIIPIFVWGYVFYSRHPRPKSKKLFFVTFCISCFSVVPVLIYQHLYINYFPHLQFFLLIDELKNNPAAKGFLNYAVSVFFIAFLIFFIAFLIAAAGTFFSKKTFRNIFFCILEENLNFNFVAAAVGIFIVFEMFLSQFFRIDIFQTVLSIIILKAILEEYSKHLLVRFSDDDKLFDINDAILLSVFSGLAFAFVENIIYFQRYPEEFFNIFLGRSILSVLAHVVFSGVFGYYYGISHFASPLYFEKHIVAGKRFPLLRFFNKVFTIKGNNIFRELKILKGLFLSTLIHTVFNFSLEKGVMWLSLLIIFLGIIFLFYLLRKKENYREFGYIGTKIMPPDDYKNLIWQIDTLYWSKIIKKHQLKKADKSN